jgi:hypothetical protein
LTDATWDQFSDNYDHWNNVKATLGGDAGWYYPDSGIQYVGDEGAITPSAPGAIRFSDINQYVGEANKRLTERQASQKQQFQGAGDDKKKAYNSIMALLGMDNLKDQYFDVTGGGLVSSPFTTYKPPSGIGGKTGII